MSTDPAPAPRLSAAQLQAAHESSSHAQSNGHSSGTSTNGTPSADLTVDPFPVLDVAAPQSAAKASAPAQPKDVDLTDESAFPSLGLGGPPAPAATPKKAALWGSGGGTAAARVKATPAPTTAPSPASTRAATPALDDGAAGSTRAANAYTTSLQLATNTITFHPAPRTGPRGFSNAREVEPTTLGEVMQLLMRQNPGVSVEASTSRNVTTFIIKARGPKAEEDGERVKRDLLGRLEKRVTEDVMIPEGLRALIIGSKGRTLKQITDSTGCNIQIPHRDNTGSPTLLPTTDEADTPLIPITLSGSSSAVALARTKILAIVAERASKARLEVPDVKAVFWPALSLKFATSEEGVTVVVPRKPESGWGVDVLSDVDGESALVENEEDEKVVVSGEREAAARVVENIKEAVAELERTSKTVTVSIPKGQHRFLVGTNADAILEATGCSVELPSAEVKSDDVTIRGGQNELVKALGMVMDLTSGTPLSTLDLSTAHRNTPSVPIYASLLVRYVLRRRIFAPIARSHSVSIFLTRPASILAGSTPLIEITGTAEGVAGARKEVIDVVRNLKPNQIAFVSIDPLVQRFVRPVGKGKDKRSKIGAIEDAHKVQVVWPKEGVESSVVVLVFVGEGEVGEALQLAEADLTTLASEAADIKTQTLTIPASLHSQISGQSGTTLNAIIGEERQASVSFGGESGPDAVVVRGPKSEVERVSKEITRIAEEAKNEGIINSHVVEFEVDTIHVRHLVGKAGSGINKLRIDLGVRVDFEELPAPAPVAGKKRVAKSKVTIKGRKENAEEARKRIIGQAERLADEVTLTITLPPSLDRGSLIGKQGAYLKRLETNYSVRINFPRDGRKPDDDGEDDGKSTNPNQVTVRGGAKGAEAAKKELLDLIEFSKEHGNVVTFAVSTKSLPRILGKAGAQINTIKEETQVTVDVEQENDEAVNATVTLRGTKVGTASAKAAILAIAKEVDSEARLSLEIPKEYHTTLIGSGGSSIRDLIARAGGPTDSRASGNAVRFPRQGEEADTVVITAPKDVAEKIKAALEKEVASLQSRVVWGVLVPQSQHAAVIGKGASALQELQRKHGVKIIMPGWNDYSNAGEIVNADELKDAAAGDIVKLSGPLDAVKAAAADLARNTPTDAAAKVTIQVPRKFHAKVAQGGRFFRSLPNGTRVSHGGAKPPSSFLKVKKPPVPANGAPTARIDDEGAEAEIGFELVSLYDDAEEEDGDIPWVIESRSKEDGDKIVAEIEKSLAMAKSATHVGWITVPRGLMPRIVGRGGAGLDKLRAGGVEVDVVGRKDANQLTLTGTPDAIEKARQSIVALAAPRPPRQSREREDY